ncbi:MAG: hypothetical protein KIT79_03360 [Deltaproteobacteria bacterium]|nr:hypothetical protein [Deltaproteobacteria bacterium]
MELLARLLLKERLATREQIEEAIRHQAVYGGQLATNLVEMGVLTEDQVALCLSRQYGLPTIAVDRAAIDPALVERIGRERCVSARVFPYRVESKTLYLLMVHPGEHVVKAEIAYSTGLIVKPFVVSELTMISLLETYCGLDPSWRYEEHNVDYIDRSIRSYQRRTEAAAALRASSAPPPSIETSSTRDEAVRAVVTLAARTVGRAVFFLVRKDIVFGWDGAGEGIDRDLVRAIAVTLDKPSIFDAVVKHPGHYLGSIPRSPTNDLIRKVLVKQRGNSLLVPVHVGGRVVNIVYADAGPQKSIDTDIGPLLLAVNRLPAAYARIISARVSQSFAEGSSA